ncbi:integrase [Arthrobacter sp. 24S4-2]|uniref:site-specific integrase n=2 Tax=Arthrobacter sp. 24S4-2 TaxID=2575374 RepID=UPI0010C7DCA1|nr:site-specific integrase [Arthrobacter sp. 24S4-2]QCO97313.1 integrase [Arthrobacter sp. 24S4-2]
MDATVRQIGERVVAALEAAGYTRLTVLEYVKWIRRLEELSRRQAGVYTPELGAEFASMTTSPRTGKFSDQRRKAHRRLRDLFDSCLLTGTVDLSLNRRGQEPAVPQAQAFIALLVSWSDEIAERGLAAETRGAYNRVARGYLLYLEANGITSLQAAEGASVLGFLESMRERWSGNSMWAGVGNLRPFLNFARRPDLVEAVNLVGAKRHYGIIAVLGDDEEEMVVQACASGKIPARDAAITLLALVTGLRACDLIALRLKDIDWRSLTIGIVQQKTGNPLTLPLPPAVAGRLAQYLLQERPDTGDEHVFVRSVAPHAGFSDHCSIYDVIRRVFKAAGADHERVGTRLLRHNAATRLLRAGTPLPIISAILGHSSPDSTNVYLGMDTEQMRACVLPLPALQAAAR